MRRSVDLYLADMQASAAWIAEFTDGIDQAAYEANRMVRSAVEREFLIIGEAMRQLEQHYPEYLHGIVESRRIVDFRNFLVHQYASVDDEEVWSAVVSKVPQFRAEVEALIRERCDAIGGSE